MLICVAAWPLGGFGANTAKGTEMGGGMLRGLTIVTDVAPLKFVPVMMTDWPPAAGPWLGLTLVTVGGAVEPTVPAEIFCPFTSTASIV